jgi:hypothetical protein
MRVIRFMALLTLTLPWALVAQESVVASDSVLAIEVASRAVEATPGVGQIWPGFWPENQGFVIRLDRDQALAVLPGGGSPDGWHPFPADPRSPLSDISFTATPEGGLGGASWLDLSYAVGGHAVPAVSVLSDIPPALDNTVVFLFHEAFHAFQERVFSPVDGVRVLEAAYVEPAVIADPRFRAGLVIERSLLIEALRCGTCPGRPTLVRQYLALRDRRLALGGSRVAATERHLERNEGTARYVDTRAALIALRREGTDLTGALIDHLNDPLLAAVENPEAAYRSHLYASGAALAALLERVDEPWQKRVEDGADLVDLLRPMVDHVAPEAPSTLDQLARDLGYDSLVARYETSIAATDTVAASDTPRLVLEGLRLSEIETRGPTQRPSPGIMDLLAGGDLDASGPGVVIASKGHRARIHRPSGTSVVTLYLDALPPALSELPIELVPRIVPGGFTIEVERLRVTIDADVSIQRLDGEVRIVVLQR